MRWCVLGVGSMFKDGRLWTKCTLYTDEGLSKEGHFTKELFLLCAEIKEKMLNQTVLNLLRTIT